MSTSTLHGLNILLTRPAEQAVALAQHIQQLGGKAVIFPTIVIADVLDKNSVEQAIKQLKQYDVIIFTSPNAVNKSIAALQQHWPVWPTTVAIAAIGTATAKTLQAAGLSVIHQPTAHFSSEALLALPAFHQVTGKRILIIGGREGRQLLPQTLRARGAQVEELAVYQRLLPILPQGVLPEVLQTNRIVCTSNVSLQNLLTLVGPDARAWLQNMPLLVASPRIAAYARRLGFVKEIIIADNATDAAIVRALINSV